MYEPRVDSAIPAAACGEPTPLLTNSLRLFCATGRYRSRIAVEIVTSFHSSALARTDVGAVMSDYVALQRARVFRRLLVRRFGCLALVAAAAGPGFHWLSTFASWFSVGVSVATPATAWVVELRRERRLARRLRHVPGVRSEVVLHDAPEPARKS
jgi:hypothetical protein